MLMETGKSSNMKLKFTKEELEKLYIEEELSTRDIAKQLNISQTTVRRYLAKYNIETRKGEDAKCTSVMKEKIKALNERYKEEFKQKARETGHRLTKVCPYCQKEFEYIRSQELSYCSKKCAYAAAKKIKHCIRCGKIITQRGRKYCDDCIKIRRKELGEDSKIRIKTECGYCHKELEVIPAKLKSGKYVYCDKNCMAAHYSEIYTGENSPTWKWGKRKYTGRWLHFRNEARLRDNYTCQICGVTENDWHKQLDVHHIRNYRYFDNKTQANQIDNLVCLCNKCHSFVHSKQNVNKIYIDDKI